MSHSAQRSENPFDRGVRFFLEKYKYELIASFGLLSLIGGIVIAQLFYRTDGTSELIEIPPETIATPVEKKTITVDLQGAVLKAGVYTLDEGKRVADLLEEAGGVSLEANDQWVAEHLNRAAVLSDGQKIYIPSKTEPAIESQSPSSSSGSTGLVNLNTATQSELETLPGIGPAYAQRIIQNRPYKKIEDLLNVPGIGSKKLEQIAQLVTIY